MGGRGTTSQRAENRPPLDKKTFNAIVQEIEDVGEQYGLFGIDVTKTPKNSDYSSESVNGKTQIVNVNTPLRYGASIKIDGKRYSSSETANYEKVLEVQKKMFRVLEKYNKKQKFEYQIDKNRFSSKNPSEVVFFNKK